MKLIPAEQQEMDEAKEAADLQDDIGKVESLASIFHAIPAFGAFLTPIGIGVNSTFGGSNLGNVAQGIARWMQTDAAEHSFDSSQAGKNAGFLRALQDRVQQANMAGFSIKQIDKQVLAQQIRIGIAGMEINNQQKQIDNANEIEEFLKNKYSNTELYIWMKGSLRTLHHQVYSLAFELAKKAEKVYCFERGLSNSNFIQAGYWDAGHDGLLCGEQLYVGLKQLEAAYQENRGYDYEITKHISLRQINPMALLQLKETGECEFILPEILFDMDYPGHFKRRIKSVSVSMPCIAGPYTSLNATLRLMENKFRNTAIAKDANDYKEKTEETDERFISYPIPINAIAASSAQAESGLFELNFKDERYLPFEGAGAISKWQMKLPQFRQFDYSTISDMVLHVRYTSVEGGERLKKAATASVTEFIKTNEELGKQEGLFAVIDLRHDLPTEWHKAMQVKQDDTERIVIINNVQDFLPFYAKNDKDGKPRDPKKINVTDLVLITDLDLQASDISIGQEEDSSEFSGGEKYGTCKSYVIRDAEIKTGNWKLTIKNTDKPIEKAFLGIRFILK